MYDGPYIDDETRRLINEVEVCLGLLRTIVDSGDHPLKPLPTRFFSIEYGPKNATGWLFGNEYALIKAANESFYRGSVYENYRLYRIERFLVFTFATPVEYQEWSKEGLRHLIALLDARR